MFGQMREAVGIPKEIDILDHIHSLSSSQQNEAFAKIQAIEREAMSKQIPQVGLVSLMEYLDERGIRKGICTRNFDAPVAHLLANHLPGHIDAFAPIITRDFKPPKPSPAGILHIARAWGITDTADVPQTSAEERPLPLIMVGDSIDDMVAGYEAGALTVLLRSEGKEELEADERTDVVVTRLDELIGLLDGGLKSRRSGSTFTWAHALQLHSTLSPFQSPLPQTHSAFAGVKPVSWRRYNIAGLLVTVYGLQELPPDVAEVTCLWLLHGRGDSQDSMGYTAAGLLGAWNSRRRLGQKSLIAVCIDQRNHGSRMIDNVANVSWKQGNPTHGPDMFNSYSGTASDISLLIGQLPHYLPYKMTEHICGGVSLGGHATWQLLLTEPRIRAGLVVIGCPDYVRLMTDRAVRSKLATCMSTDPPGRDFIGSHDFPPSLLAAVEERDPAGILLSELDTVTGDDHLHPPSESEKQRLRSILAQRLGGKKIMCLSGGKDRLVPPECGEPLLTWLKKAVDPKEGWANDLSIGIEDIVDPGARHEFSKRMRTGAERWLCDLLASDHEVSRIRESKL
ncbi:hypothetical protein B0A55_09431 [Friedmanniomyces simplex]|uniref:AB hydrolase-1 domain-containing protein n=1 Tax=Friedmanniomyces simplex TaxID=329884 RepID=A0A4U0WTJ9_9PEZI|nr:hypothetical protein B0A55_09431 [Friedmanniomyces simplex]